MGGKTLTRADLAEAVVQKVGLPRNESQELVELILQEISTSLAAGDAGQALLVRLVRHPQEGPARRAQSEDRARKCRSRRGACWCSGPSNIMKDRINAGLIRRRAAE